MINGKSNAWYTKKWFLRALMVLGIAEVLFGAFRIYGHDAGHGYAFIVLGLLTFAASPWIGRKRNKFSL